MTLTAGEKEIAVAQLGPNFLIVAEPTSLLPTDAELVVTVDGDEDRRKIDLPDGIRPEVRRTPIGSAR
jgi:hypothetical protein